jgi:predicted nucleic acid-binding protein
MKIFIDTSAWDAIEDSSDPNHEIEQMGFNRKP